MRKVRTSEPVGLAVIGERCHLSRRLKVTNSVTHAARIYLFHCSRGAPREQSTRTKMPLRSHRWRWSVEPRLVAEPSAAGAAAPAFREVQSARVELQLRPGVQQPG